MSQMIEMPDTLVNAVAELATERGVSVQEMIETILDTAVREEAFFARRRRAPDWAAFDRLMSREGGEPPRPGDELPEGMTWESLFPNRS